MWLGSGLTRNKNGIFFTKLAPILCLCPSLGKGARLADFSVLDQATEETLLKSARSMAKPFIIR